MAVQSEGIVLEFYQQQHKALLRYLCRKLGTMAEAADVAQQTYEKLLRTEQTDQINNPKAFVYKMATNLAIDVIRKRNRQELSADDEYEELDLLPTEDSSPEDIATNQEAIALVKRFIGELPAKCRFAFLSYKFEDRDYKEIAEFLGVSESMIRKYVIRAMAYCRDRLEQHEWSAEPSKPEAGAEIRVEYRN